MTQDEVKVIEAIYCSKKRTGDGLVFPVRVVVEVFDKDGTLIASNDPMGNYTIEQMVEFAQSVAKKYKKDDADISL